MAEAALFFRKSLRPIPPDLVVIKPPERNCSLSQCFAGPRDSLCRSPMNKSPVAAKKFNQ
jgi:hypothetical protein